MSHTNQLHFQLSFDQFIQDSSLFSLHGDQSSSIKSSLVHHDYCVTINLFRSAVRPFPSIYLCRMQNWTKTSGERVSVLHVYAIYECIAVAGYSCNIDGSPWRNHGTVSFKLVHAKKVYRGLNKLHRRTSQLSIFRVALRGDNRRQR